MITGNIAELSSKIAEQNSAFSPNIRVASPTSVSETNFRNTARKNNTRIRNYAGVLGQVTNNRYTKNVTAHDFKELAAQIKANSNAIESVKSSNERQTQISNEILKVLRSIRQSNDTAMRTLKTNQRIQARTKRKTAAEQKRFEKENNKPSLASNVFNTILSDLKTIKNKITGTSSNISNSASRYVDNVKQSSIGQKILGSGSALGGLGSFVKGIGTRILGYGGLAAGAYGSYQAYQAYKNWNTERPGANASINQNSNPEFFPQTMGRSNPGVDRIPRRSSDATRLQSPESTIDTSDIGPLLGKDRVERSAPGSWQRREDIAPDGRPASVRYNNPGAAWPSQRDENYGIQSWGMLVDPTTGQQNRIGRFPSMTHGAAANMDLLSRNYVGKTMGQALSQWRGGNAGSGIMPPGMSPDTVITPEMTRNRDFMKNLFRAFSRHESGKPGTISEQELDQAFDWYQRGGAGKPSIGARSTQRQLESARNYLEGELRNASPEEAPALQRQIESISGKIDQLRQQNQSSSNDGSRVVETQREVASTRTLDIKPELRNYLDYAAERSGVNYEVSSGGQHQGRRTGSNRHNVDIPGLMGAADGRMFEMVNGRKRYLDINNPEDRTKIEKFTEHFAAVAPGAGVGTGYMGMGSDTRRLFHFGGPNEPGGPAVAYAGPQYFREAHARGRQRFGTPESRADYEKFLAQREQERKRKQEQSRITSIPPTPHADQWAERQTQFQADIKSGIRNSDGTLNFNHPSLTTPSPTPQATPVPSTPPPAAPYIDQQARETVTPSPQAQPQTVPTPSTPTPPQETPKPEAPKEVNWTPGVMNYWKQGNQGVHV